jgi:hypothetical protein
MGKSVKTGIQAIVGTPATAIGVDRRQNDNMNTKDTDTSINASNSKDVITGGKFATGIDETSGKVRGKKENRNYRLFFLYP